MEQHIYRRFRLSPGELVRAVMHWINAEHNYSVTGLDCPEVTVEHEDGKSGVLGSDDVVVFVFEGDLDD